MALPLITDGPNEEKIEFFLPSPLSHKIEILHGN